VPDAIRILLLADSHLGFDLPSNPRVDRRRRGHDFLTNYHAALAPALAGEVDILVHGGDVFDRPSLLPSVAYQAFEPLRAVAARGIPVFIVPGNHERSRLPHARFASHPLVHVFDRPRTFVVEVRGHRVALAGFPYERTDVRLRFPLLLGETGWSSTAADVRLLCLHHCFEGATVGPGDYTFRTAADVIRARDLPAGFSAVMSGHIHRYQVLTQDLRGHSLAAPVCYPGSIERTSFAEADEAKGYMIVEAGAGIPVNHSFHPLPARPMIRHELSVDSLSTAAFQVAIESMIAAAPPDAVLLIRLAGSVTDAHMRAVSFRRLRTMAPRTMTVDVVPGREGFAAVRPSLRVSPNEKGLFGELDRSA
jgi:exonuclease SbcD